ncbi:cytochrome P450 [Streptomyces sp. NBC_01373]|uniref:cytochrome P450 n=1 Tax=Streptomyces sp. NBC_01373 TaxID=2903843 RepID=UPI0022512F24|nr:cytochrome P450 [Streptomyces sp. NBC_01373]MCX4705499.1 cytochrome P450 [Streptomyces sp. NBC_01373]
MAVYHEVSAYPFAPGPLSGLPAEYAGRRARRPFGQVGLPSGHDAVLLVTHADAAAALADVRLSHDLTAPGSPRVATGPSFLDDPKTLLNKDGEEHLRIRRIVASAFTPRRVERWRPTIRAVASDLIDRIESGGPTADLVDAYCTPLPVVVIGKLLGVPDHDTERFERWSNAFALAARMTAEERKERIEEFAGYIAELLATRRATPGNDLIDDLIAARDGEDRLSEPELAYLVMSIIVAGTHTTSNVLGRGVLTLLRDDRFLWRRLATEPAIVPAAVDEVLRVKSLGDLRLMRLATEDVELPSGTVPKGQAVVIAMGSAMSDEAVYEAPDKVLLDRNSSVQLMFGGGPHFCLGAHLAKAELQVGLGLLAERLPGLRLAARLEELRFTEGEELSSLESLPVSW